MVSFLMTEEEKKMRADIKTNVKVKGQTKQYIFHSNNTCDTRTDGIMLYRKLIYKCMSVGRCRFNLIKHVVFVLFCLFFFGFFSASVI